MTNIHSLVQEVLGEACKPEASNKTILKRARANYNAWSKNPGGRLTKAILFALQNGRCKMCNRPLTLAFHTRFYRDAATMDHIVPLSVTRKHSATADYQILCMSCNNKKASSV